MQHVLQKMLYFFSEKAIGNFSFGTREVGLIQMHIEMLCVNCTQFSLEMLLGCLFCL